MGPRVKPEGGIRSGTVKAFDSCQMQLPHHGGNDEQSAGLMEKREPDRHLGQERRNADGRLK